MWSNLFICILQQCKFLTFLCRRWCDAYDGSQYDQKNANLFADIWEHCCGGLHFRRGRFLETIKIIFPSFYVSVIISLTEEIESFHNVFMATIFSAKTTVFKVSKTVVTLQRISYNAYSYLLPIAYCLSPIAFWQYQD